MAVPFEVLTRTTRLLSQEIQSEASCAYLGFSGSIARSSCQSIVSITSKASEQSSSSSSSNTSRFVPINMKEWQEYTNSHSFYAVRVPLSGVAKIVMGDDVSA